MPRAKFYDDMGVGRRLPLAGGCYASARPAVDGGVVITVRDAKARVLYGGDEIRPRGRFGDDVPFSISAEALRKDAERLAGDWKQREQLHQNYRAFDRCRDDDDRQHRFHGGRREDDRGRGELRRVRADADPREEGSPRRYTPEEMPAALRDFQRQLDEHYGRRPRAADARRRLRARLRDQGWSDDAIDALEDYFHEWSASHTDMIMADPAVEADPDRSGAPLTNGPGQTGDGNHSAGLQFDWYASSAIAFMNSAEVIAVNNCIINPGGPTAYEGFAVDITNGKYWCTNNGTTCGPDAGSTANPATNTGGITTAGWAANPIYIMMGGGGDAVIISTTTFHFTIPTGFHGLELMLNWPRIGFAWGALALCLSVALVLAQRLDHRYVVSALAQSCSPDPAPSQATNAGFTCETFRWGNGDTANEIDAAQTYQLGHKFYWGTANLDGQVTVASDYSVQQPSGKIFTQTSIPADHGAFVLNTCGGPPSSFVYTVGQYFQHGWYLEAVMEWNATGFFGFQTSFYGFGDFWEVDNPDAFAFDQSVVNWGGGTAVVMQNNNHTFFAPTVETGTNRYGALSTPIDFTWWINDSPNGAVSFRFGSATDVYNAKECFGIESTSRYSITLNSFKVWQTAGAATPPTGGGGLRFMRL